MWKWIVVATVALGASCSDSVDKDDGTGEPPDCPVNQEYNPISGACQDKVIFAPNNGGGPDDPGDMGGGEEDPEEMGTDEPVDMGPPDLGTTCEGFERRCVGNTVEQCVQGMFQTQQVCEEGFVCNRGNCIPVDDGMCMPGETRCAGATFVQTCEADGMTWSNQVACPMGEACVDGVCTASCAGLIDAKSNVGCEYFTMRHNQASGVRTLPHSVVVSNPDDEPVTVKVSSPGGLNAGIADQTIQPLDSAVLTFPTTPMINQNGVSSNIYVIRSSKPVIATQFAPLNNPGIGSETSDASLLLPTNAVGKEYIVVGWPSLQPGGTWVDIVALSQNTTVSVTSPVPLSGGASGNVAANATNSFVIPANSVLHLSENRGLFDGGTRDLSGVTIVADQPVAVYTGATIINVPDGPVTTSPPSGCKSNGSSCTNNADCCTGVCGYDRFSRSYSCEDSLQAGDHVEQQLFPVESWGKTYIAAPFFSRITGDFSMYRVVGGTNGTTVTLDPPVNGEASFTLNRGQVKKLYSESAFELTASQPVMLAQFMIGGQVSSTEDGDPAFLLPPAIEQYRDSYVFLVPGQYRRNFVTIVKKTGTSVTFDGNPVTQAFIPVSGPSTWEYTIVDSLTPGVHRANSTEPFGIVVHGMDEYISYAFSGGITLPE